MMHLDDLYRLEKARRLDREMHHQHGTDTEIGGHQHAEIRRFGQPAAHRLQPVAVKARRAHDHVKARVQAPSQVLHDGVGTGEVDDDVGLAQAGEVVPEIYRRHQGEILGCVDGRADRQPHPPPAAEHTDPDRVGHPATTDVKS